MIVEPEREVPGTTDNTWKIPILNAVPKLISSREVQAGFLLLIIIFDQNKDHTINNQCNRNNYIID